MVLTRRRRPPDEPEPDGWFTGVPNYDGFDDHADAAEVTVQIGAGGRPAIGSIRQRSPSRRTRRSPSRGRRRAAGTTSNTPTATGENPEGVVDSGEHTYERSFTEPGTHRYQCWPHAGLGMKGAVFVDASAE
ncbi:halocyanin domain protein [Halovivax asiaticus JCM 14624]|uniref:Halocyanin domain protein n=1 Tax=Halovivax asiaticus JCM 14624 TaxID=1227490 RepID=M0BGH1_9EURY|nr:plastocyanin/azurin family copper-binding protein [Halovivax asiaticus]ELZ09950.1 halocyanin domain protein [Halovivax asiaticus JCM 14624]